MQYIMKMIERMEQTEKKKAQAGKSAPKHGSEGDGEEKLTQPDLKESTDQETVSSPVKPSVNSVFSAVENVSEPNSADVGINGMPEEGNCEEKSKEYLKFNQNSRTIKGKKKRVVLNAHRRRLRTISGSSDQSALCSSADESACITPASNWSTSISGPSTSEIEGAKDSSGSNSQPFRFPKTKKVS